MAISIFTSKRQYDSLKIYIDEILHLHIKVNEVLSIQSWIKGNKYKLYYIELMFKDGTEVLCDYDSIDKWNNVLSILDEYID